ncbi:MAG TPA: BTAD domain-containing putative transcriptional regulator [Candidatus Limnocylindria bacterium]|nr:BTAD domain-containing putative transcriptional regulator [Candidatus Limnocylindria bacterium]
MAGQDRTPTIANGWHIERARLRALLVEPARARLTIIQAGAGYGKSTTVREWLAGHVGASLELSPADREAEAFARRVVASLAAVEGGLEVDGLRVAATARDGTNDVERASAIATVLAELLERTARSGEVRLALDDLHELADSSAEAVVAALVRQVPAAVQLMITSRTALPFPIQRLRARGEVRDLDAQDLALTRAEVERVIDTALGGGGVELGKAVLETTGGWPAAVRLLVESLRDLPPDERVQALDTDAPAGRAVFDYFAEEVFSRAQPAEVVLVRRLSPFDAFDAHLAATLDVADADRLLEDLERRGMFVRRTRDGLWTIHRLVRDFARQRLPLSAEELRDARRAAIDWHEQRGDVEAAIRMAALAGDRASIERLLVRHAGDLLQRGRAEAIVDAVGRIPPAERTLEVDLAQADALAFRGRPEDALAVLQRLVAHRSSAPAAIGWRMARIHYERGMLGQARAAVAATDPPLTASDEALLLAYDALTRLFTGATEAADHARRATAAADALGDDSVRSMAHMAAAYALRESDHEGARRELRIALEAAERAGDVIQIVRLRDADDELPSMVEQFQRAGEAVALMEAAGNPAWLYRVLVSRAVYAIDLGRYELAAADLERARQVSGRLGLVAELFPIAFMAELSRIRGDIGQAELGFRRALEGAGAAGDEYVAAFARSGLARVLARTQPGTARELAERSLTDPGALHRQDYLLSAGWVAACQGRVDDARRLVAEAMPALATTPGAMASLASAIELDAMVGGGGSGRRLGRLAEAATVWARLGNEPAVAQTSLAIAVFEHGPASPEAASAWARLEAMGIRASAAEGAGLLAVLPVADVAPLRVRVLGGFAVIRNGQPVPLGDWKSRKSRDLLKLLVTRRGPITRDELMEHLWPDEPPDALGNRLSVALSLLRSVLDPGRAHAPDRFVTTERQAVALRAAELSVDLEDFISDARAGLAAHARGAATEAGARLSAAEASYAGDLLPEDAFSEWAAPAREEARSLYVDVVAALASLVSARGDHPAAVRYLMRAVAVDPFHEGLHLALVEALAAAGQRAEAHRAYRRYVARMSELEVEPASYPV